MKPADLTFETLIGYLSWKFNFNFNRNHYLTISSLPICIVLWLLQKDRNKWKKQYLDCLRDEFSSKLYSQRVQVQTVCQLKVCVFYTTFDGMAYYYIEIYFDFTCTCFHSYTLNLEKSSLCIWFRWCMKELIWY